ncbi:MAG: DUF4157 domain-containing protein, partial [Candidatus Tectomicrobia bacterium]|nr:DUF4157 domain-containing protein [Candidatus Tectomicrobia bacterium]
MEKAPAQRHPAKTDGQQKSSLNASHVIAKQTAVNDSPDRSSSRVHNGLSDHLLHLQRVLGNRAVGRLIQAKLSISHPDDPYEREADQVADTVMRMPEPEASEASDTPMQTKPSAPRITPLVQRETEIGDDEEDIEVEPTLQRELGDGSEDEEDDIVATKPLIQRMPESELEEGEEEEAVGANSSLQRMPEPEPEADAESVVATQPLIQRMTAVDSEENEEETVAAKRESGAGLQVRRQEEEEEELVQSKLDISYNPAIQRQDEEEDEDEEPVQAGPLVQRQVEEEEDELAQTKPIENRLVASRETPIQPKGVSAPAPQVSSATAANVQALKGGGSPLPQSTRAFFEPRFGVDFSQVRVHTDSRATETTKSIHARAFTVGRDIAFGTGRYAPHSHEGRQLLAHELTHVVQQNGSQLLPVQPQATDRVIRVATSLTPDAEIKKGSEIPDEGLNASRGNADRLARRGLMQREMISRRPAERGNSRKVISNFLSTPVQVSSVSRFLQRNTASGVGSSVLQGSGRQMVFRDPVAPTPVARRTAANLFGDGTPANPGLTLAEFEVYTRIQADWFVEPSLTSGDRNDLWNLLLRLNTGSHILAGVGDLKLSALRAVSASDWLALAAFGRCCHTGGNTIRIAAAAAYTLPQRIALGKTLLNLESLIPPELLKLTVSEVQLSDVQAGGLMLFAKLAMYWLTFQPHLQQTYAPVAGARGPEFQRVLDLINGPGIIPFLPLLGRIRNLHRFSVAMLTALVSNFADTSRSKPVHLVLHTGHDERAFQESAHLFEDLVVNSPNLVLMLEGQASLAAITARIPALAAAYGQPDATGNHRIAQAMIAGHGQARTVQIAGTGAPTVGAGRVDYPSESIDLDRNAAASTALIDTLLRHLDPATARLVYAGCLVGSNPVPLGTPAAAIPGHIAANPSLGT